MRPGGTEDDGPGPAGPRGASRAPGRIATTLSAFRVPGYPIAWAAYGATVAGWSASMVVVGWIALELSNSSFVVGATYAARLLPSLFLGIPMGALADRLDRRTALSVINAIGAAALVLLAVRAATGSLSLVELLLASVVLGIVDTFRGHSRSRTSSTWPGRRVRPTPWHSRTSARWCSARSARPWVASCSS